MYEIIQQIVAVLIALSIPGLVVMCCVYSNNISNLITRHASDRIWYSNRIDDLECRVVEYEELFRVLSKHDRKALKVYEERSKKTKALLDKGKRI